MIIYLNIQQDIISKNVFKKIVSISFSVIHLIMPQFRSRSLARILINFYTYDFDFGRRSSIFWVFFSSRIAGARTSVIIYYFSFHKISLLVSGWSFRSNWKIINFSLSRQIKMRMNSMMAMKEREKQWAIKMLYTYTLLLLLYASLLVFFCFNHIIQMFLCEGAI